MEELSDWTGTVHFESSQVLSGNFRVDGTTSYARSAQPMSWVLCNVLQITSPSWSFPWNSPHDQPRPNDLLNLPMTYSFVQVRFLFPFQFP